MQTFQPDNRIDPPPVSRNDQGRGRDTPAPDQQGLPNNSNIIDITTASRLQGLPQRVIDWLLASNVTTATMIWPTPLKFTKGEIVNGEVFSFDRHGAAHIVIEEDYDTFCWNPKTNKVVSEFGTFAIGTEAALHGPVSWGFDGRALNLYLNPLRWLQAKRDGIVILDWSSVFGALRDVPRVDIDEELLLLWKQSMRPPRLPEIRVRRRRIS